MRITIIAIGKLKESYWKAALDEYLRRLKPWAKVSIIELPECEKHNSTAQYVQTSEGKDICKHLAKDAGSDGYLIALDSRGRQYSSESFAAHIEQLKLAGKSRLTFIIGGSHGLSDQVLAAADQTVSLGTQTWPHQLARVMLAEQLYRAMTITAGHPYHK
ncbi:MAG: 23S rRNA (pseudouridine(1915)-N(3))-methyltransferase RlmH [Coriobacteriia bacterium]|nr:23S rRNA (pseudouridine(1915)-N(3))-methyltransferase RlmH [Coriobacteriia bacterium]